MAVGCGAKCAKATLLVFNVFFWLTGCILLAIGLWLIFEPGRSRMLTLIADTPPETLLYLGYLLSGLGGFILLAGFFGCCGALQESRCLLGTYLVCLVLILLVEAAVGAATAMFRARLLLDMEQRLQIALDKNYLKIDRITEGIDYAQVYYMCCGVRGGSDYLKTYWRNQTTRIYRDRSKGYRPGVIPDVPITCCRLTNLDEPDAWRYPKLLNEPSCVNSGVSSMLDARHQQGCLKPLKDWFTFESFVLAVFAASAAGLVTLGIILVSCLCRRVKSDD